MRAGYDRVYSDIVSPIVPDLPAPQAIVPRTGTDEKIGAGSVLVATALAGLVIIGMITAYLFAPHQVRTSSINDAIVASQPTR